MMDGAVIEMSDMRFPEWVVRACGVVGSLGFTVVLMPQALRNIRRHSTQGMNVGTMAIWHAAALLAAAYYASLPDPAVFAALGLSIFSFFSGVLEAQAVAYRGCSPKELNSGVKRMQQGASWHGSVVAQASEGSSIKLKMSASSTPAAQPTWLERCVPLPNEKSTTARRLAAFLISFSAITLLGSSLVAVLFLAFRALPRDASFVLGSVASAVLFVVGFLLQVHGFFASRDASGYAFLIAIVDLTGYNLIGCAANIVVLCAPRSTSVEQAFKEAAPFVSIIAMQVVLLLVALFVICCPGRKDARAASRGVGGGMAVV